jgi:hypothetical protein
MLAISDSMKLALTGQGGAFISTLTAEATEHAEGFEDPPSLKLRRADDDEMWNPDNFVNP